MFVRVWDSAHGGYYKSIVYGIIDTGYFEKYVVLNPFDNSFEAVDYLVKGGETFAGKTKINIINAETKDWYRFFNNDLLKLSRSMDGYEVQNRVPVFYGYEDVFQSRGFLFQLLKNRTVPRGEAAFAVRSLPNEKDWHTIETQEDADKFMSLFMGFHDSTLERCCYEEGDGKRDLHMIFGNTGWYSVVEFYFEGLLDMHIRPPEDNTTRELLSGCLLVYEESVYWADEALQKEDLSYHGSYVKAYSLKWKKIS